jgi:amino acid transporter
MGAVIMSPSLGLYFNWAPMSTTTGKIAPLIFLVALLISLPTAVSYAMVSKELPAAGQAYTWLWRALRPSAGIWLGPIFVMYYLAGIWLVNMFFGLFFAEFLRYFGVPDNQWAASVGIVLLGGLTALIVYRDIRFNAKVALGFMIFESLVAFALAITILIHQGGNGHLNLAPFDFRNATAGFTGIKTAVIFGILSFIGYDYACVVAEESKTPRRLMPLGVLLAAITVGLFWIICSYAYSESVPLSQIPGYINSGFTAITPIAKIYWGPGRILITISGLTASIGIYVAAVPVTARVLYAMARDGAAPKKLATIHPDTQIPANGVTAVLIAGTVGALLLSLFQHSYYNAYVWFGESSVFFALVTYILVNIASIAFYRRFLRDRFSPVLNLLVPVIGIGLDLYVLWQSFFVALWNGPFATGRSVVLFAVAWCVVAFAYVTWLRVRKPEVFAGKSYVLPEAGATAEGVKAEA